jgi:hypothetical protein
MQKYHRAAPCISTINNRGRNRERSRQVARFHPACELLATLLDGHLASSAGGDLGEGIDADARMLIESVVQVCGVVTHSR